MSVYFQDEAIPAGAFPMENSNLYKHLKKYENRVTIDPKNIAWQTYKEMEEWCEIYVGHLNEYSPESPWQVILVRRIEQGENCQFFTEEIEFAFLDEKNATAFKLAWT